MTAVLANRLRDLRTRRTWTQSELAERIGVSRRTIQALENGTYAPSVILACLLARVLDHPVEAVFQP